MTGAHLKSEGLYNILFCRCSSSVMLQDNYILVRETSGAVLIWDVYTGELVTAVNDVNVSCVSSTPSALIIGHKQCIHVYHTVLV